VKRATLWFSPLAWLHWQFLCHNGDTEATAFGVTHETDPLLVTQLWVPKQECTFAFTEIENDQVNDLIEWAYDVELKPHQVRKVWLHTHPGDCPRPSWTDEKQFDDWMDKSDMVVMAILARGGDTYARVRARLQGKVQDFELGVAVRWDWVPQSVEEIVEFMPKWDAEYKEKVKERKSVAPAVHLNGKTVDFDALSRSATARVSHGDYDDVAEITDDCAYCGNRFVTDDPNALLCDDCRESEEENNKKEVEEEFRDWLWAYYELEPEELDAENLKQAWAEFEEGGGEFWNDGDEITDIRKQAKGGDHDAF
jgi:hypothetical protein